MDQINSYPGDILHQQLFAALEHQTSSAIHARLEQLRHRLEGATEPVMISIGENCAAGMRLREAGLAPLGSHFFDNVVIRAEALPALIDADFADMLSLSDLCVDIWEGNDSVLDRRYGIHFHHYFHLRGAEKDRFDASGRRRRRIDETDIPLFLAQVRAQFEYLAAKFRLVMRAPLPKILLLRRVGGEALPAATLDSIRHALNRFGAINTRLVAVHSSVEDRSPPDHVLVAEDGERWGSAAAWADMAKRLSTT